MYSNMAKQSIQKIKKKSFPDGCQMCGADAQNVNPVTEIELYGKQYHDFNKYYWKCGECFAYVGCHEDGLKPYGILANGELRVYRKETHALFDPIWQYYIYTKRFKRVTARNKAYEWLAKEMGIKRKYCHIGMFTSEMCLEAIEICSSAYSKSKSLRRFKGKVERKEFKLYSNI